MCDITFTCVFIRLPSSWGCGLAETVGLCFRVDSDCVTLGFVLGLVCVCVFVLFCSVVVVSFVVGRQQHCRCIVIDAMVYPKNWILEDEFGTGKTSGVFGLNMVFLHLVLRLKKILNLEVTTLCMNRQGWVLDDASSSIFHRLWQTNCHGMYVFGYLSFVFDYFFDHECDLEPRVFFYGYDPMIRTR